jgi:hypothetical protein
MTAFPTITLNDGQVVPTIAYGLGELNKSEIAGGDNRFDFIEGSSDAMHTFY